MKEYELLSKYHYDGSTCGVFDVVSVAIHNKVYDTVNVDKCREQINEILDFMEVKNRFDMLFRASKNKLEYSKDSFRFEGHKFKTLTDVEKALKMKAFL